MQTDAQPFKAKLFYILHLDFYILSSPPLNLALIFHYAPESQHIFIKHVFKWLSIKPLKLEFENLITFCKLISIWLNFYG